MVEVYIHLPTEEAKDAVACGIKLSEKQNRVINYHYYESACFTAWLHPDDDVEHSRDENYRCVKLLVKPNYCFVADRDLYQKDIELYNKTLKPYEKYQLGEFRHPEALVTCTIVAGKAILQGQRLDTPLLYENSEILYKEKLYTYLSTEFESFSNDMLYAFFEKLAEAGELDKTELGDCVVFVDNRSGKHFTFDKIKKGIYEFSR